jgi:hypothetical protein
MDIQRNGQMASAKCPLAKCPDTKLNKVDDVTDDDDDVADDDKNKNSKTINSNKNEEEIKKWYSK